VIADVLDADGENSQGTASAAIFAHHDVTDEQSWTKLIGAATATFGPIDALVNNAGVLLSRPCRHSKADFERVLSVNLTEPFSHQLVGAHMQSRTAAARSSHFFRRRHEWAPTDSPRTAPANGASAG